MAVNAVNVLLVAFSKMHHPNAYELDRATTAGTEAQLLVFFNMVAEVAEVTVCLVIIVTLSINIHWVDINCLNRLNK